MDRNKPLIFINMDNYPTYCDSRCGNTNCTKHITMFYQHVGGAKIGKLKDTEDCEGYISAKARRNKDFVTESDTLKEGK